MANGFSADVGDLRAVGDTKLPSVHQDLVTATRSLVKACDEEQAAFSSIRPELCRQVALGWQETTDVLVGILRDNQQNIELAGEAILEIARRYQAADEQAIRSLPNS